LITKHAIPSIHSALFLAILLCLLLLLGRQLPSETDSLEHLGSLVVELELGDDYVGGGDTDREGLAVGFIASETFDVNDIYLC